MALKRVTMQDIADACGLSRNTVSKIFNNRGTVPESTRRMVLLKAQELGYAQFTEELAEQAVPENRNIALLTQHKLLSHNFGSYFVTSFIDQICRFGYTMRMYEVSAEEIADKVLSPHLDLEEIAGIVCVELFDRDYLEMLFSQGLPCVCVDSFAGNNKDPMRCDYVTMENYAAVYTITDHMIAAGAKSIGFVGDKEHCNSFYERWRGYCDAVYDAGLSADKSMCILEKDCDEYADADWLISHLENMPSIPDGFVCANDFLAIHLMTALKKKGLRIPDDVMISGFDGSPEASIVEPTLTTARIPSNDIGRLSATILVDKIRHPELPFRWTSMKSELIFGNSTK